MHDNDECIYALGIIFPVSSRNLMLVTIGVQVAYLSHLNMQPHSSTLLLTLSHSLTLLYTPPYGPIKIHKNTKKQKHEKQKKTKR